MKPKINKELLPMKGHYFLFSAGTAPVVPFMPTLARQMGFSSVVVGTIYSILPIIGLLTKPIFGFVSDKFQSHKLLFILAQGLTAVAFFCIMFIPNIPTTVDFHCHGGESVLN
uniref:Major facilitator superfamily (MFS) profile domain-containing protein n=1 Tax=Megaselia scalaris TaxID=36166 RepID=T1GU06_MEGSC